MSSPPPTRPAAASDPLRAFRDRAAVILAEQRGFTPQCRLKLARVAKELGLSDSEAEEAIRSLKRDVRSKPADDPIAEKFRQRLRKDLAGRHRTVIGPEIEARVVESAQRKYGLDEPTVRQVLAEVAAELGLRHITGDQAVQLFADVVDQAVGDSTWLAREAWVRLRTAGEKWGLSFEEADELVEQKIAANRRATAAGRLWNRLVLGGSLTAIAAAAVTLLALYYGNRGPSPSAAQNGKSSEGVSASAAAEQKKPPLQPQWWDVDLAVAMATARRELSDVAALYDALRSDAGATRREAYQRMVDLALKIDPEKPERSTIIDLLSGCHALDPDEACAAQVRDSLRDVVPGTDRRLTRSTIAYQRAYQGMDVALAMLERRMEPKARRDALAAAVSSAVGSRVFAVDAAPQESRREIFGALTRTLYRHLTDHGPAQPEESAELQPYLAAQAAQWLAPEDVERLNATFLVAMLTGAEKTWKTFEPLMDGLAASRDPLIVLELLGVFRRIENRALQKSLGDMLVRRTGAKPRSEDPREVARAVRLALGASGVAVAQSAEDRWEDLKAAAEPALARTAVVSPDRGASWSQTIELARLATQAMALAQGESGCAIFDELVRSAEEPVEETKVPPQVESGSTSGSRDRPPPLKRRPPTLQEKQFLARALAQLAEFESQSPVVRSNALRMVASRVPVTADLTYEQATIIARYLVAPKEEGELESIAGALDALRSWKQVRLALADRLGESKLTPSQRDQLLARLTGSDAVPAGATAAALRPWLLKTVLADVEGSGDDAPPANGAKADAQAGEALAETYRQRARVLAVPAAEYQTAQSPASALELVVGVLGRRTGTNRSAAAAGGESPLAYQLEAARYLGESEPQRTVLLQRLLLSTMSQRIAAHKPSQAAAALRILGDLAAADASAEDLLVQLRGGERATLEMGMLYAGP